MSDNEQLNTQTTSYKTTLTAIRKARRFALQGLYEWHISKNPIHEIEAHTRASNAMHTVHLGYYHELLHEIVQQVDELDTLIASKTDRTLDQLDGVERAALRIGTYELKNRLEIPFKVVIDEAIQLNAHFGSVDGHKYINAVLDNLAKELRTAEVTAVKKSQAKSKPEKDTATQKNATQKDTAQKDTTPKDATLKDSQQD